MANDFEYYLIVDLPVGAPIVFADTDNYGDGDDDKITGYLWRKEKVSDDYITHLVLVNDGRQIRYFDKNFDRNTGSLTLDNWNVFSQKIKDVLDKHMPIKGLQLVKTSFSNGKYSGFYIANVYQELETFNKELCGLRKLQSGAKYLRNGTDKEWWRADIDSIVLDEKILSKIPLEDRLVYSEKNSIFILYHKTIVDIIKSVNPVGMAFVPVEKWYHDNFLLDVACGRIEL
jgi:hypothetical protein